VQRALRPEQLHFGIVDQSPPHVAQPLAAEVSPARMSCVRIDPVQARGPCWARALALSLYDDEDWFLQIDSHMDFEPNWDERLIRQAQALLPGRAGLVISSYPNAFVFDGGRVVHRPSTDKVLAHFVKPGTVFASDHPVLGFEAHPLDSEVPVTGFHVGAGCLFAPGEFARHFPYDPHLYFHGEEQAIAARLFTHGWDIFHMPGLPLWHLYNEPGAQAQARTLHWDASLDAQRGQSWWLLEQRSRRRLKALLEDQADLGVYGLGRKRSLADYADFSGIDYARRSLADRAYRRDPGAQPMASPAAQVDSAQA
jgi:hypothetical protein